MLVVAVFAFMSCNGTKGTTGTTSPGSQSRILVDFESDSYLSSAITKAKAENKLVFVDFYTTWCGPCKLVDKEVFSDQSVGDFMNDHFVSVKVNAEKANGPTLAAVYNVSGYPTLLFLNQEGEVLEQQLGGIGPTAFKRMAKRALDSAGISTP